MQEIPNVIAAHKPADVNFAWDDPRFFNRMEDNTVLETLPVGTTADLCERILPALVPGFEPIPFSEIGRKS